MTMQQTKIEWTDYTVNFWEGCQKVGPGCDNCYAETRDMRFTGGKHWGPGAPRRLVKGGIAKLRKINRDAPAFYEQHGRWPRVFCSSLSDIFDNFVDPAWRMEAFAALSVSKSTRPQLLTKRVGNVEKMVPASWLQGQWPQHVGLMITVVNQEEASRDIPKLLDLKTRMGIPWVGISYEPALGPIFPSLLSLGPGRYPGIRAVGDTYDALTGEKVVGTAIGYERTQGGAKLDWVICGGESGPKARPMHPDWARNLRDSCQAAGVPFLFKQWGEWIPYGVSNVTPYVWNDFTHLVDSDGGVLPRGAAFPDNSFKQVAIKKVGKKAAGRLLDGIENNGVPA